MAEGPGEADRPAAVGGAGRRAAVQRRTVRVLGAAQVASGIGVGAGVAAASLLAEDVSGSASLSGLVGTASVLGAAVTAFVLGRVMSRHGRRPGLVLGWCAGAVGGGLVVLGGVARSFPLLLLGAVVFGAGSATGLQARYAATDLAEPEHRARALSLVVWATTVGAVAGPNLSGLGARLADALGLPLLTGPYVLSAAVYVLAAALSFALLRPDPLLVSRADAEGGSGGATGPHRAPSLREGLAAVRRSPAAVLALTGVVLAHAVMVGVMTMTPVHMREGMPGMGGGMGGDGGAGGALGAGELRLVGLVISVHIAGMYAFSPAVGWLADRIGRVRTLVAGQAVLLAAVLVAGSLSGSVAALSVGLLLLGLGWSFALVSGSTLLSESVPEAERPGVQGAADVAMNGVGAAAGALSGVALGAVGYGGLAVCAGLLTVPVLVLAARQGLMPPRQPVAERA
jgi:MFS family permease